MTPAASILYTDLKNGGAREHKQPFTRKKPVQERKFSVACFFYEICQDLDDFQNMEECQTLYKALVSALSLEKHAAKVIDAFIQRHVRDKKLTPLCDSSESRHIFDFRGELSKAYKEDAAVYDKCGSWSSSSEQDVSSLAVRLLSGSGGMSLLLYGAAGAGKTEYARSLARTAGLTPLVFKNELELDGDDNKSGNNALCRLNCILSLPRKDSVIIVDEAETVLKTRGSFLGMGFSLPQKGTVNKMLENSVNKVIWMRQRVVPPQILAVLPHL